LIQFMIVSCYSFWTIFIFQRRQKGLKKRIVYRLQRKTILGEEEIVAGIND
jgi:hypothetical protein